MACMVIGELWIYAHVITTLVLQDLLESFSDRGDFLPKIRNDECHQFFHLPPGVDPASVAALEHNFEFLELTATFAPEPVYPHHSIFQASFVESAVAYVSLNPRGYMSLFPKGS